jgi:Thiamine biosynthesis enzyme ThiH and related uncharacterized enzymes
MSSLKERLYAELKLKLALSVDGVTYEPGIFDDILEKNPGLKKQDYCTWDLDLVTKKSYNIPSTFLLENGFPVGLISNKDSIYSIVREKDRFFVKRKNEVVSEITFPETPKYYSLKTEDGTSYKDIGNNVTIGYKDQSVVVAYSTECSVKEKGQTCLFCVFNGTKGLEHGEGATKPLWKYPHQIANTIKAAYNEGATHLTITGGFIPERREVEYYLDVAENIKEILGRDDFNGTACIGAPLDFTVIDKYKEAGYSTISFNTEVWREEFFGVYCPGKVEDCGGYENWINAIKYAVKVFGEGNVRSNFVAGLQPKEILLEGIDYLASIGVVAVASPWVPALGSPLEGHRSPTAEWHWDVQWKIAQILRKYGRTYQQIFNATAGRGLTLDLYEVEDETWPSFDKEALILL